MINTYVGKDLQGVQDWMQLANILKSDKPDGVKSATVQIEKDVISITVNDGKSTQSITLSVPDLGRAEGIQDTDALNKLASDIESLMTSLSTVGGAGSATVAQAVSQLKSDLAASVKNGAATTGGSVNTINTAQSLFDLYALMALMLEVAQTQRDKSREIRLTENQQIQNSIMEQAADMRSAATISLAFGLASSCFSAIMSIGSMIGQSTTFARQSTVLEEMDIPKQNLKAAQMLDNPEVAESNFESVKKSCGPEVEAEALEGTPDLEKFEAEIGIKRDAVQKAEEAEQGELDKLNALKAQKEPKASSDEVSKQEKAYLAACEKTKAAKASCDETEQEFFGKLDAKQQVIEAEISAKRAGIFEEKDNGPGWTKMARWWREDVKAYKAKIAGLEGEVGPLLKKDAYLRAYTTNLKAKYASDGTKSVAVKNANENYGTARYEMERNTRYTQTQQMMNRWMGIQQVTTTLSQMTNSAGNMSAEITRSNATLEGVEQAKGNEQLDQIKDLFSQAETVVQAVIQLMQAVLSAENDSVMAAIRA